MELRNERWNDIFFRWAWIWAIAMPSCKSKTSRFLKDRLRIERQRTCCLPHSVFQGSPLWGGGIYHVLSWHRAKASWWLKVWKHLKCLREKDSLHIYEVEERDPVGYWCATLTFNLWCNYSPFRTIHICWFGKLRSQSNSPSLPRVMVCYFLSCSTFRSCCKGKLYVESIVIASRTQPCDIPFPFGPFKKVIWGSSRHVFNV